jgi:hypothetical protein
MKSGSPSAKLIAVTRVVAEHYARSGNSESLGSVLAGLATADPQLADAVIRGFAAGWPKGKPPKLDDAAEKHLAALLIRLPSGSKAVLIRLATTWGSKSFAKYAAEAAKSLLATVRNGKLRIADRVTAARELVEFRRGDGEVIKSLLKEISPQSPPRLSAGILQAIQRSDAKDGGALILARFSGLTPSARTAAATVLLSRSDWTATLLDALQKGTVQLGELSLDQKQALTQHPNNAIRDQAVAILKRGGALPNPDRLKVIALLSATAETPRTVSRFIRSNARSATCMARKEHASARTSPAWPCTPSTSCWSTFSIPAAAWKATSASTPSPPPTAKC